MRRFYGFLLGSARLRIISAWLDPGPVGLPADGHPAQVAARTVQRALACVLSREHYPRRISCDALRGTPAEVLLGQARETGLLVLGATGTDEDPVPGATARYCLRYGRCAVVLVPAGQQPAAAGGPDGIR